MQCFVFRVKKERVKPVSILSVLHILNISWDIFNKVGIFFSALFQKYH